MCLQPGFLLPRRRYCVPRGDCRGSVNTGKPLSVDPSSFRVHVEQETSVIELVFCQLALGEEETNEGS